MRMRQLGRGQSVLFVVNPQVLESINALFEECPDNIDSSHIVRWTLEQTHQVTERIWPLWIAHGLGHRSRQLALQELYAGGFEVYDPDQTEHITRFVSKVQEEDAKSLQRLYGPAHLNTDHELCQLSTTDLQDHLVQELLSLKQTVSPNLVNESAIQEEQEREVAHEVEREQEIKRPPKLKPLDHILRPEVVQFVEDGIIPQPSSAFVLAFGTFRETEPLTNADEVVSSQLYATSDHIATVAHSRGTVRSQYVRPVNFILSSVAGPSILVVISPFEANALMDEIRLSQKVRLHFYEPRVTMSMDPRDIFSTYVVPEMPGGTAIHPLRRQDLNLFAGQLYLASHHDYINLCKFLGLVPFLSQAKRKHVEAQNDGFVTPPQRLLGRWAGNCPFRVSLLRFLRELLAMRRKGIGFAGTHMGQIIDAKTLTEDDFRS